MRLSATVVELQNVSSKWKLDQLKSVAFCVSRYCGARGRRSQVLLFLNVAHCLSRSRPPVQVQRFPTEYRHMSPFLGRGR